MRRQALFVPRFGIVLAALLIASLTAGTIDSARSRDSALREARLSTESAIKAANSSSAQIAQLQGHVADLRTEVDRLSTASAAADRDRSAEADQAKTQIAALERQVRQLGGKPVTVSAPPRIITVPVPGPPIVVPAPTTVVPPRSTTTTTAPKKTTTTTTKR